MIQRDEIERRSLAEMTLAPHVQEPGSIATPEVAVAAFDDWLNQEPADLNRPMDDLELEDLIKGR